MNRTFKVISRHRKILRDLPSWVRRGKPGTQYKKVVYTSYETYKRWAPVIIKRWGEYFDIEEFELIDGIWWRI